MSPVLTVHAAGPLMTVQDMGRRGVTARGLSRGGAVDRLAILEAAALLNAPEPVPAIEMAGKGGEFSFSGPARIALTGAPMRAFLDDAPIAWNATHAVQPEQRLTIGSVVSGTYGYLTPARSIALRPSLGGVSAHLAAGLGSTLRTGDEVPLENEAPPEAPPRRLAVADRFRGGVVRVMPGPQTDLFSDEVRRRFFST
ncbi:MAG: urea amidolyase, partial [Pseudomonadota bacterium]